VNEEAQGASSKNDFIATKLAWNYIFCTTITEINSIDYLVIGKQ
jgi:hypothetical protein